MMSMVATYFLAVILPWVCLLVVTAAIAVSTRPIDIMNIIHDVYD